MFLVICHSRAESDVCYIAFSFFLLWIMWSVQTKYYSVGWGENPLNERRGWFVDKVTRWKNKNKKSNQTKQTNTKQNPQTTCDWFVFRKNSFPSQDFNKIHVQVFPYVYLIRKNWFLSHIVFLCSTPRTVLCGSLGRLRTRAFSIGFHVLCTTCMFGHHIWTGTHSNFLELFAVCIFLEKRKNSC